MDADWRPDACIRVARARCRCRGGCANRLSYPQALGTRASTIKSFCLSLLICNQYPHPRIHESFAFTPNSAVSERGS